MDDALKLNEETWGTKHLLWDQVIFNIQDDFRKHGCVWDENKSFTTNSPIVWDAGALITSKIALL